MSARKSAFPIGELEGMTGFERVCIDMCASLLNGSGIMAEIKRKSPSKGVINPNVVPAEIALAYEMAGASAVSVLTDERYFGGTLNDLAAARSGTGLPILRKEFVIDEYQLYEAKAWQADAVLLIAAALPPAHLRQLARCAKMLGLGVLLEVHNRRELEESFNEYVDMLGVNNRNLKTFEVSIATSLELAQHIPDGVLKVAESGISKPETVKILRKAGYRGFLMGEHFMRHEQPGEACAKFVAEVQKMRRN